MLSLHACASGFANLEAGGLSSRLAGSLVAAGVLHRPSTQVPRLDGMAEYRSWMLCCLSTPNTPISSCSSWLSRGCVCGPFFFSFLIV